MLFCHQMPGLSLDSSMIDYAADHAEILRKRELERGVFFFQSPQLQFRSFLINWIRGISEQLKFNLNTVHLAVYVLDVFMDNHQIDVDKLHLVALICISLSAKYEEHDVRIPQLTELNRLVCNPYPIVDLKRLEGRIFKFLGWTLNFPTASHFAEYYSLFAVIKKDWDPVEFNSYESFWTEAQRAVRDYLDLSLLDVRMLQYQPSVVACACILLARQQLRLSSKWTDELIVVTQHTVYDLLACANNILSKSVRVPPLKRALTESPDHGYATGDSSHSSPGSPALKRRAVRKRCFPVYP